jgi:Flp pilus assembly protein TadG
MGMVEFGQYFYAKHTIQAAARDGARTAIVPSATNSQVTTAVANTMSSANFGSSGYSTSITDSSNNAIADLTTVARGSSVKVTVTVNYGKVGVRPLGIISATKPVTGITTMIKE